MRDYCRNLGSLQVAITKEGKISIAGDCNSNFGMIYPHCIEGHKRDNTKQVIGMEWGYGLTVRVKAYIYGLIQAGRFDHLIKEL
jgi:hypothetical protein